MKKTKLFIIPISTILVAACGAIPLVNLTSCSCSQSYLPKINKEVVKPGVFHELSTGPSGELEYRNSTRPGIYVHLFNDSQVAYVDVCDYVKNEMKFSNFLPLGHDYTSETNNKKTIITNTFNNAQAIIDYEQQTISFDDYDSYRSNRGNATNPFGIGTYGGEKYLMPIADSVYVKPTKAFIIDLKKYNLKAYYKDNHGYLPFSLLHNIINGDADYAWIWNGNGFYEAGYNSEAIAILYTEAFGPESGTTAITPDSMEFFYNLLALTLDARYGLIERPSRATPGTTIKYFPNGAYEALKPYHDRLVSLEPDVSAKALKDFFNNECDDGGHTRFDSLNILSTKSLDHVFGKEDTYLSVIKDRMEEARDTAEHTPLKSCQIDLESSPGKENDIAWMTIDSFDEPPSNRLIKYEDVTKSNYMDNTVASTMYLQKLVTGNNPDNIKVKTIVVDLSCNGGGIVWTQYFLLSYLCGGTRQKLYNPKTGAYSEFTVYADINSDQKYTEENDKLPDDINLFFITSNFTFSCGNTLATAIADSKPNAKFIGDTTGGGGCFVETNFLDAGLGSYFQESSCYHVLRKNSTRDNPISTEPGIKPSFYYMENTEENASKFYDREFLKSKMFPSKQF